MLPTIHHRSYMCCPPYITGPDPGISARLMHVGCMTHMHLTTPGTAMEGTDHWQFVLSLLLVFGMGYVWCLPWQSLAFVSFSL